MTEVIGSVLGKRIFNCDISMGDFLLIVVVGLTLEFIESSIGHRVPPTNHMLTSSYSSFFHSWLNSHIHDQLVVLPNLSIFLDQPTWPP